MFFVLVPSSFLFLILYRKARSAPFGSRPCSVRRLERPRSPPRLTPGAQLPLHACAGGGLQPAGHLHRGVFGWGAPKGTVDSRGFTGDWAVEGCGRPLAQKMLLDLRNRALLGGSGSFL